MNTDLNRAGRRWEGLSAKKADGKNGCGAAEPRLREISVAAAVEPAYERVKRVLF